MEKSIFCCPNCRADLIRDGKSLYCTGARRHCFDLAAQGYVNLSPPRAVGGGDDETLIAARRAFLATGHYRPVAEKLQELLAAHCGAGCVLDAGCGEGYYTNLLASAGFCMAGVDLSRCGIRAAAQAAKREGLSVEYAVGSLFSLPAEDDRFDAVVSLFAPVSEKEFIRVLRPGGILLTAEAGPKHLFGLKQVLYDTPYENERRADAPVQLEKLAEVSLRFVMQLTGEEARGLFAMTPYYYRTPKAGLARLAAIETLSCEADVCFRLYKKGERL